MEGKIRLPESVHKLIKKLNDKGYEAYAVGGCVRDSLRGERPDDWDMTTNALPQEMVEIFKDHTVISMGIDHGTVGVCLDGELYEITTYRVDGTYSDHRRPDKVQFTPSLREDLARRDFTINAMAYHPETGLVDYYGGLVDLERGIIRCVGVPAERFQEDALRILRCTRFASQLAFTIEKSTAGAMLANVELLDYIAAERIQSELNKSLVAPNFRLVYTKYAEVLVKIIPEIGPMIGFQQNTPYHAYDVFEHTMIAVDNAAPDLELKLTMLLHDVGKPPTYAPDKAGIGHFPKHATVGRDMAKEILQRLRYGRALISRVLIQIERHNMRLPPVPKLVKRWLHRLGEPAFRRLLEVQYLDASAKEPFHGRQQQRQIAQVRKVLEEVLEQQDAFTYKQLEIDGDDLQKLGMTPGPPIGEMLHDLLGAVMDDKVENTKADLQDYAKTLLQM